MCTVEEAGGKALPCIVDVRDENQVRSAVELAVSKVCFRVDFNYGHLLLLTSNLFCVVKPSFDSLPSYFRIYGFVCFSLVELTLW